jgi:hypothetical protein
MAPAAKGADAKLDDNPKVKGAIWNERTRWPSSFKDQLDPRQLEWQSDTEDEPPGVACNAEKAQQRPGQLHCHDDRLCPQERSADVATYTVRPRGRDPGPTSS